MTPRHRNYEQTPGAQGKEKEEKMNNRVNQPRDPKTLTPRQKLAEQKKETARRRAFEKHARQETTSQIDHIRAERERAANPYLQALYEAFLPEARITGITSKYVSDKWGNRIRRTEVTV